MRNILIAKKVTVSFKKRSRRTWESVESFELWEADKISDFYVTEYPDLDAEIKVYHNEDDDLKIQIRFNNNEDEAAFILRESL